MNTALWIVAGVLAVACVAGGAFKVFAPKEKLAAANYEWVEDFSGNTVKSIGALEVLAGIGLILPAAVDIAPVMVPVAASGLVALMIGAFFTHYRRNEPQGMVVNVFLLAVAGFIAWGRFGPYSF